MSALLEVVLAITDPINAILVLGLGRYLQIVRRALQQDIRGVRTRVERLEGAHIPDGGRPEERQGDQDV